MTKQINLTETLNQLNEIAEWFEQQREVDVEEGLKKVKEAAGLIKASKERLKEIENEFVEIKAEVQATDATLDEPEELEEVETIQAVVKQPATEEEIADDIPF